MRNLLIIAYEFPPSAGGGVQRIAKFARYLPESGWRPTVLCAEPAWGRPTDPTLLEEVAGIDVVRLPSRNISARIARSLAPLKGAKVVLRSGASTVGPGMAPVAPAAATGTPLSTRILRRYWIDAAEPWARTVPAAARRLHARIGFDAVLASGPPPSALVAGARVAREIGVPLVADFRDAWATHPDFRRPERPRLDARTVAEERSVIEQASAATAVSEPIAREILGLGGREVLVIPNGFDPADLPRHEPADGPLRIAFMGRFYGTTDPASFFDGMALAVRDDQHCEEMVVDVVGQVSDHTRAAIEARGLGSHVRFHGFRSHDEALAIVARADAGLVSLADRPGADAIYTGKLFEYLGMGLPVLLVGPPEGVAATLIEEARAGVVVPYGDAVAVAGALGHLARLKEAGAPIAIPDVAVIARFDRRSQAAELGGVLDRVAAGNAGE